MSFPMFTLVKTVPPLTGCVTLGLFLSAHFSHRRTRLRKLSGPLQLWCSVISELLFHQASLKFSFIVCVGWSGNDVITKTSFFPLLMKAPPSREEEMGTGISGPRPKDASILGIVVSRNISIWLTSTARNYVLAISAEEMKSSCKHV